MGKVKLMMHNNFFFVSISITWKDNVNLFQRWNLIPSGFLSDLPWLIRKGLSNNHKDR